ncbi:MAG TPA: hypothetical protein VFA23_13820 [Dongiaceae bacterium]|nr:hypothetical protein [Dongiaceae bacterium]
MKRRATAKPVVVHDLDQAAAALAAAASLEVPVAVWSAPRTAIDAGVGWFSALARLAREAEPRARAVFILDCGDRADLVQEAFRDGLAGACFSGGPAAARRLADIARKSRARLHRTRPTALDLGAVADPAAALREFLAAD